MRIITCALGLAVGLSARSASADYSKAWAAAKDNLPANTQFVLAVDVAAVFKQPLFPKALEAFKDLDKDLAEGHTKFKQACGFDPLSVVDGIVVAGDTTQRHAVVVYVQLTIDRTKASACLSAAAKAIAKELVTVKQDGVYTVATAKTNGDNAYFPWVAPNVVMIAARPEKKDVVDQWFNQKGFAKSLVSGQLGNLDMKAVATGAFASDKPIDSWVPVTKAYGNLTIGSAGKIAGTAVVTATDAATAKNLADEFTKELDREKSRDKTTPTMKKILAAMSATSAGNQITFAGSVTGQQVLDAYNEETQGKKKARELDEKEGKEAIAKMEGFQKRMCACKDKKCADKVQDDMTKWGTEMAKNARPDSRPSVEMVKKSGDIMTKYTECFTKILTKDAGPPPP
jgi:hypothetical protein